VWPPRCVSLREFSVSTSGKGNLRNHTRAVALAVAASGVRSGTVTVFVRHTSCSLIIMKNADSTAPDHAGGKGHAGQNRVPLLQSRAAGRSALQFGRSDLRNRYSCAHEGSENHCNRTKTSAPSAPVAQWASLARLRIAIPSRPGSQRLIACCDRNQTACTTHRSSCFCPAGHGPHSVAANALPSPTSPNFLGDRPAFACPDSFCQRHCVPPKVAALDACLLSNLS
jgi:Uncharacterised protein family UPF0047